MKILMIAAVAVLATAVMTLLSAVPPLSYLYDWAESNHMMFMWNGLTSGVTALCLSLYFYHQKKQVKKL